LAVLFRETHGQYHEPKGILINPIESGRIYPDTASTLPKARKRT